MSDCPEPHRPADVNKNVTIEPVLTRENAQLSQTPNRGENKEDLQKHGFPDINFDGIGFAVLKQEAPHKSQGLLENASHTIKHAFAKDPSLEDQLKVVIEKKMTAAEKRMFNQETESEHSLPAIFHGKHEAEPMHEEIEKRVHNVEAKLVRGAFERLDKGGILILEGEVSPAQSVNPDYQKMRRDITQLTINDYRALVTDEATRFIHGEKITAGN